MVRKLVVYCDGETGKVPFDVSLGTPKPGNHPLKSQSHYIQNAQYASIPSDVMDSIEELYQIGNRNSINSADLCVYALGVGGEFESTEDEDHDDELGNDQGEAGDLGDLEDLGDIDLDDIDLDDIDLGDRGSR